MSVPRIQIYAWGANSHGQTGTNLPDAEELHQPTLVHLTGELSRLLSDPDTVSRLADSCRAAPVGGSTAGPPGGAGVAMTGGGGHSVLLVAGRVFTAGLNDAGQLARDTGGAADGVFRPVDVEEPVTSAACGWDHTLLLTSSGRVLTAGSDRFGQRGLGGRPQPAPAAPAPAPAAALLPLPGAAAVTSRVAAGLRHSVVVTSSGDLLVCGDNSRRQLGTGADRLVVTPRMLPTPAPVTAVSCGQRHTVMLCLAAGPDTARKQQLYGMGDNRRGQLLGQLTTQRATDSLAELTCDVTKVRLDGPSLVQLPEDVTPVRVHCGWTHTIVECADGRVRGWGRSDYGQLQLPAAEIRQLAVGSEHGLALTTAGRLLAWGWDEHGAAAGQLTGVTAQEAGMTSQGGEVTSQEAGVTAQEAGVTAQEADVTSHEGGEEASEEPEEPRRAAGAPGSLGMTSGAPGPLGMPSGAPGSLGMPSGAPGSLGMASGAPGPPVTASGRVVDVTAYVEGAVIAVGAGYGCSFAVCLVEA